MSEDPTRVRRAPAAVELEPGARVGRYEVTRFLAEGGMGAVYLARDPAVPRTVALKVMPRAGTEQESRFHREVRAAAQLAHPNIVRLFDVGEQPDFLYYTMEYVDGPSLARVLKDTRPLPPRTAMRVARDVARALSHAHEKGIIHRDIKPGNILLVAESAIVDAPPSDSALATPRGFVAEFRAVLADFGLAREVRAATALTISGDVIGTPLYMSPEQAAGQAHAVDARADVYSLGAVLYESLTGALPSPGGTTLEVIEAIRTREPAPPRRLAPSLSRDAETIVMKALSKERERRYATAAEFADDIERYLRGEAVRARPPSLMYRARKAAARRPGMTAGAGVFIVAASLVSAYLLGPAWVDISTEPAGAQVFWNGEPTGAVTPTRIRVWPSGSGTLTLGMEKYGPKTVQLSLMPWRTHTTSETLDLSHGILIVEVEPTDAQVEINSINSIDTVEGIVEILGVAPSQGESVLASASGSTKPIAFASRPWTREAEDRGREKGRRFELGSGSLDFNVVVQVRPGTWKFSLPKGDWFVESTREGFEGDNYKVTVIAGQTVKVTRKLKPLAGTLIVATAVSGARMTATPIDVPAGGVEQSYAIPIEQGLTLPVGRWRLRFEKHNHFTQERQVRIEAGRALSVNATLEAQERWRFRTDGEIRGRPLVADLDGDGRPEVVVGSWDNHVYAFDADGALRWKFETNGRIRSSPAAADLDGDGRLEVVVGSDDKYIYALGVDGTLHWRFETGGEVESSPAAVDLDGDGRPEVVVGSSDRHVYALGGDGTLRWKFATRDRVYSSPAAADLDGDGRPEVVVGSKDSHVYALGADGTLRWKFKTGGGVFSSPAVADLDSDGRPEVVVGSVDGIVYALSTEGMVRWKFKKGRGGYSRVVVEDLDGDGRPEVVVVGAEVYVLASDGTVRWVFENGDDIPSSLAASDLDGDGRTELVVGSLDKHVYAFDADGTLRWRFETGEQINSYPEVADLNGDGMPEVVVGSDDKHIYVLNAAGRVRWRFMTGDAVRSSATAADLDGDGRPEMLVGSNDSHVYAFGADGTLRWRFETGGEVRASPAALDLDGDGTPEVVVGSLDKGIYALNADGTMRWKFETEGEISSSPAGVDLDGDGRPEVVVGSQHDHLYALNAAGKLQWKFETEHAVASSPAAIDLDGDGRPEVMVGLDAVPIFRQLADGTVEQVVGSLDEGIYALNADGTLRWNHETAGGVQSPPVAVDLDGDGRPEVVVGSQDDHLYAINADGTLRWKYETTGGIQSPPAVADLDGDGRPEVVVQADDEQVYVLNADGTLRWKYQKGGGAYYSIGGAVHAPPTVADLDVDGRPEVLVGSWHSHVYALEADGTLRRKYEMEGWKQSPTVTDLDGDGLPEVIVGSGDGSLYVFPGRRSAPPTAVDRLRWAWETIAAENYAAAVAHAEAGLRLAPSAPLRLARVVALARAGRFDDAFRAAEEARVAGDRAPALAVLHAAVASHAIEATEPDLLAAALRADPAGVLDAYVEYRDVIRPPDFRGRVEDAARFLKGGRDVSLASAAAAILRENYAAVLSLPRDEMLLRDDPTAAGYAHTLLSLAHSGTGNPDFAALHRGLARGTLSAKRFSDRMEALRPEQPDPAKIRARADDLARERRFDEAFLLYERALAAAPDDLWGHNNYAWWLAVHAWPSETEPAAPSPGDRSRRAVQVARRALELASDDDRATIEDTLAAALYADGQVDEAIAAQERALAGAEERYRAAMQARLDAYRRD